VKDQPPPPQGTVFGMKPCVPRPLGVKNKGIRAMGVAARKAADTVHTINIIPQRKFTAARCFTTSVMSFDYAVYAFDFFYLRASDLGGAHGLVPATVLTDLWRPLRRSFTRIMLSQSLAGIDWNLGYFKNSVSAVDDLRAGSMGRWSWVLGLEGIVKLFTLKTRGKP
jgi:hypothetical protein